MPSKPVTEYLARVNLLFRKKTVRNRPRRLRPEAIINHRIKFTSAARAAVVTTLIHRAKKHTLIEVCVTEFHLKEKKYARSFTDRNICGRQPDRRLLRKYGRDLCRKYGRGRHRRFADGHLVPEQARKERKTPQNYLFM